MSADPRPVEEWPETVARNGTRKPYSERGFPRA